jgi:hypothetical protein
MSFSFDRRATVDPDVMIRNVGEESVILDLRTGRYLGLDEVGTRMWHVIVDATSIQSAFEMLLTEYEVDADRLRIDMQEFLNKLIDQGLVTLVDAGAEPVEGESK